MPPLREPQPARPVPLPLDERAPARRSIPVPPNPPSSALPSRRQRQNRKINPAYCFNHDEASSSQTCADCRLAFCDSCLAAFQGQILCGPCKNFRLRGILRPPRLSGLSIVALVTAMASGPVAFCLGVQSVNPQVSSQTSIGLTICFCLLGMLLPAGALVMGLLALRDIELKPNVSGRAMALTGTVTALVGVLWNLTIGILMVVKQIQS